MSVLSDQGHTWCPTHTMSILSLGAWFCNFEVSLFLWSSSYNLPVCIGSHLVRHWFWKWWSLMELLKRLHLLYQVWELFSSVSWISTSLWCRVHLCLQWKVFDFFPFPLILCHTQFHKVEPFDFFFFLFYPVELILRIWSPVWDTAKMQWSWEAQLVVWNFLRGGLTRVRDYFRTKGNSPKN